MQINDDTPKELLDFALGCVKKGYGIPAFYNDNLVTKLLQHKGVTIEDSLTKK